MAFKVPERYRNVGGQLGTKPHSGNFGLFFVPGKKKKGKKTTLKVIASDGMGFEHVSVSKPDVTPTWEEMDFIKDMFWSDEDLVVQYHVPKKDHVNNHNHCLHLWRKKNTNDFCELPLECMV